MLNVAGSLLFCQFPVVVVLFRQLLSVLIFVVLEVFNVDCCRSGCCPLCIGHCWLLSFGNFYLCLRTSFVEPALIVFSCTCSVLVVVFSMLVVLAQHHLCARTSSAEPPLRLWQATWPTLTKRAIHLSTRGVSVFVTVDLLWSGQSVRSFFLCDTEQILVNTSDKSDHPHQREPWCFAEVVNKVGAEAMPTLQQQARG